MTPLSTKKPERPYKHVLVTNWSVWASVYESYCNMNAEYQEPVPPTPSFETLSIDYLLQASSTGFSKE